jgi:protein N-terminal amidase
LLTNYRKTNLFCVDEFWAKPGTGFAVIDLPGPLNVRVALGVCMDLNVQPPDTWSSLEGGPYELATFTRDNQADVLILLNAWLASNQEAVVEVEPDGPDICVLDYWYTRLRPLWSLEDDGSNQTVKDTTVVVCNRCGREDGTDVVTSRGTCSILTPCLLSGTLFAGTSTIFRASPSSDGPHLFGCLTRSTEKVAVWNV